MAELTVTITGKDRQAILDGLDFVISSIKGGFFEGGTKRNDTDSVQYELTNSPDEKHATQFYDEDK